jgi:type VI protein secretion system component VasF
MHLMITIALGVFGGLWLFVTWAEWRERRAERKELRQIRRQERRAERQRATAEHEARLAREAAERAHAKANRPPRGWFPVAYVAGLCAVYLFLLFAFFPH